MPEAHKSDLPRRTEAEQRAFYDAVFERCLKAEAKTGTSEHFLDVAGTIVRLIFAGDRLERDFITALAHLEITDAPEADVTFHVWDSDSTGVEMAARPFPHDCFTDRGDIWGFTSKRIKTAFHWIECSVNLFDTETNTGIYWVQSPDALPYWTKASPLRTLMHWWMEQNGCQLLHAAAFGHKDGAALITGKGGVGKSTTALACLAGGLDYIADDYLIVQLDPEPRVHSLYNTAKLNADQLKRFPQFQQHVTNHKFLHEEKAVMYLHPHFSDHIAKSLALKAVLTPQIGGRPETSFRATSPLALQRAAAFTTMSQLPYAGRQTHDFVERLVAGLPGLEIVLGHEIDKIPGKIETLLAMPEDALRDLAQSETLGSTAADKPLISVVIPVYNGARFMADAVENIVKQNYPSVEIIVVDDGSTDDIEDAIARLPVDVRFFRQENAGAAAARNRGIKDVSGEFIAFLDVDDQWPENNLNLLVDHLLAHPGLDLVHGHAQLMEESSEPGRYEFVGNPRESFPYYIGAALYRRSAFERVGLFDKDLKFAEDTDWFNRATEIGIDVERLDLVTLHVLRHSDNMTRGKSLVELNTLKVFKKSLDRRRAELAATRKN